jgi:hypothetical protein
VVDGRFGIVLLPVLYMIFGLNALPDRVLAWLNVGVQDLGATHAPRTSVALAMAQCSKLHRKPNPARLPDEGGSGGSPRGRLAAAVRVVVTVVCAACPATRPSTQGIKAWLPPLLTA